MKHLKDDTKPEGFHSEFKQNVRNIFFIGLFIMIVAAIIVKWVI